jgi:hypothetical protein
MPGTGSFSANSKVQKQKSQRSQFNLSNSTVQKVISGDPDALAKLANLGPEKASGSFSDSSSQPPSTASSSSSTPKIDAIGSAFHSNDVTATRTIPLSIASSSQWPLIRSNSSTTSTTLSEQPVIGKPVKSCCCGDDSSNDDSFSQAPPSVKEDNSNIHPPIVPPQPPIVNPFDAYNHPFNLQNNAQFLELDTDFSAYELSVGCDGMHSSSISPQHAHKDCNCGDTCACFACATHPNNRTTIDYVRYHNELVMRTEYEQIRQYLQAHPSRQSYLPYQPYTSSHQNTFGNMQSFTQQPRQSSNLGQPYPSQNTHWSQPPAHTLSSGPTTASNIQVIDFTPEPHPLISQPQIPMYDTNISLFSGPSFRPLHTSPHQPLSPETPHGRIIEVVDTADSPDDTSTLSPSSFLLQQFSLPDCSNVSGTCLCGDGCNCPECLTHRGHNDVEQTSINGAETANCCGGGAEDERAIPVAFV